MRSLLDAAAWQFPAFGAQESANLMWALAVLRVTPSRTWMAGFMEQVGDWVTVLCCALLEGRGKGGEVRVSGRVYDCGLGEEGGRGTGTDSE
jgi:hypothetical protein